MKSLDIFWSGRSGCMIEARFDKWFFGLHEDVIKVIEFDFMFRDFNIYIYSIVYREELLLNLVLY